MGNSFFNEYPYTDFHELNLSWVIKELRSFATTLEQFVSINALKYADPIQWDITSQYEKNTIVIDPQSGTAYISVAPVPAGVALTNTDYWTIVFDLERFVTKANGNFTPRVEVQTTTTATFPTSAGEWVIWGGDLYRALSNIIAGDQYVVGSNIERITVEEAKDEIVTLINSIFTIIGDLSDLTTTDKTSIVNAINELVTSISVIGSLSDLDTTDKTSIVNAINEIVSRCDTIDTNITNISNNIGNLADLTTTDKTSIVNAINEINGHLGDTPFINVKDYGAVGDGITDDADAIQSVLDFVAANGGGTIIFPNGRYYLTKTLQVYSNTHLMGVGDATLLCKSTDQNTIAFAKVGIFICGTYTNEMDATQTSMGIFNIDVADGAPFAKNDVIEMHSTSLRYTYQAPQDGAYAGYMAIVENVSSNTLTLDHNPYSLAPDAKIRKINAAKNIHIEGLKFEGLDTANSQQHGIWAKYAYNLVIENCDFYGFDWYSIGVVSSVDTKILNNRITGTYYDGITGTVFYGIAAMNSNYKMIVSGNSGNRLRHLFVNTGYTGTIAYGAPCKITVENNIMIGCESQGLGASYAYEHHGMGFDILFDGNIADGCYSGFNVEGTGVIISNNIITNYLVNAISVGDAYDMRNITIAGNKISNYIGEGRFTDQIKAAIFIDGAAANSITDILITDNEIMIGSAKIVAINLRGAGTRITVSNNHISTDRVNDSLYAITCTCNDQNNAINGNSIYGFNYGIRANCYSVRDNLVSAPGATLGMCFYIDGNSASITGNTAFGAIGISLVGNNCKVVGNVFSATSNTNTGTSNTLIGNYPASFT